MGFSHFVVISEANPIDLAGLGGETRIIVVIFEKSTSSGSGKSTDIAHPVAYAVEKDRITEWKLSELIDEVPNLRFDLQNFGFVPTHASDLVETYENVKSSLIESVHPSSTKVAVQYCDCGDLLGNEKLASETRKLLLDFYTLRAASICVTANLVLAQPTYPSQNNLTDYSKLLVQGITTRAMYDKLMFLVATVDSAIDGASLDSSKSKKKSFLKKAARSTLPLTKKVQEVVESLQILDDNYRSPEIHKKGRLFSLVQSGHTTSLMNEICSFQNRATDLFVDVCGHLRSLTSLED